VLLALLETLHMQHICQFARMHGVSNFLLPNTQQLQQQLWQQQAKLWYVPQGLHTDAVWVWPLRPHLRLQHVSLCLQHTSLARLRLQHACLRLQHASLARLLLLRRR